MGIHTRTFGLTCDRIVSMDVVTADGVARNVSATSEADLFWALRGRGRITDDFTFEQAANDDEFQRIEYVTVNDGLWSTIGVLVGGLLLIGLGAAVIARVLVRRSSTARAER
jgi:hypothetical protein